MLWAAAEASVLGRGSRKLLADVMKVSGPAITSRIRELHLTQKARPGSLAKRPKLRGVGRKLAEVKDEGLQPALERMVSEEIAGDPMTHQKWVRSSLRNLSKRLEDEGHEACIHTVARLLRKMGYSLRVNKLKQAGAQHPDRDKQFRYIAALKGQFLDAGLPVISIDTKKKELIGNYKRPGASWSKDPIEVDAYFASYAQCVVTPFGIYDLAKNAGYVTVGLSHNTAEFAVSCLVEWWKWYGSLAYPNCDRLLILADGGGGNGYNLRTWKNDLQDRVCDSFRLSVTVSHYPPGCSKWNPVEYRLFSHISMNWAGRPLRNLDTMLAYIRGTTTSTGLKVEARLDQGIYRNGRRVTSREFKELALATHETCPTWNYTLYPRSLPLKQAK
jgi:hypothetical protein